MLTQSATIQEKKERSEKKQKRMWVAVGICSKCHTKE